MPRPASSALYVARARLSSKEGWRLFVEIPSVSSGYFRLVNDDRHLVADTKTWQAAAISMSLPEEDLEGTLGEVRLTVPNVSRLPLALAEVSGEFLGQTLTAWIANTGSLASFGSDNALKFVHRIVRVEATEKAFMLACRHVMSAMSLPRGRYTREAFPQLRVV